MSAQLPGVAIIASLEIEHVNDASGARTRVAGAVTGISLLTGRLNVRTAALSWSIRIGAALGVVFIMTVKPDFAGSALVVVAGTALGGAAGSLGVRRFLPA